jgi:hypothetical protein
MHKTATSIVLSREGYVLTRNNGIRRNFTHMWRQVAGILTGFKRTFGSRIV